MRSPHEAKNRPDAMFLTIDSSESYRKQCKQQPFQEINQQQCFGFNEDENCGGILSGFRSGIRSGFRNDNDNNNDNNDDNNNGTTSHSQRSVSADTILANELNKLTFRERETINEEIHGIDVRNIEELRSTEETTEILKTSFHDMDNQIKTLCSTKGGVGEMAYAFNLSQKLFGSTPEKGTYLNTNKIRIMFIRCERFDCQKAAERICFFAGMMYDLYGDVGLERLALLTDLDDEEMLLMKEGCSQLFPGRDRAGRRIYMHFFSDTWNSLAVKSRLRITSYILIAMLLSDVVTQRRGFVAIFWIETDMKIDVNDFISRGIAQKTATACFPLRLGAAHVCFPSTKCHRNGAFIHMISGIAGQIRGHMRIHSGSPMECIYALESFGITSNQIPLNRAYYKLDVTNHNLWLELCTAKEKNANLQSKIIECPDNFDILFGRGQIVMNHPGNIMFRNFIQSKLEVYSNTQSKKETTHFTWAAVRTLKNEYGARFLKEDQIGGNITSWVEVSNELARSKLRVSFRDARTRLAKFKGKETIATKNKTNNDTSITRMETKICEDFEPLPFTSISLSSKRDNDKISTKDYKSLSSMLFERKDDDSTIHNDISSIRDHLASIDGNLTELNSSLKTLVNQQISDSSTSTFLGFDVSSKRQRLCAHNFFDCA